MNDPPLILIARAEWLGMVGTVLTLDMKHIAIAYLCVVHFMELGNLKERKVSVVEIVRSIYAIEIILGGASIWTLAKAANEKK